MPLKMNPQIRAQWAAALRSCENPQGRGALRGREGWPDFLGKLCELAVQAGVLPQPVRGDDPHGTGAWLYGDGYAADLPPEVVDWAGLDDSDPSVMVTSPDGRPGIVTLSDLSDTLRWSFARIADTIDGGA